MTFRGEGAWRVYATLLVLSGSTAASAAQPKSATPLGNPGDWVTSSDYPLVARMDRLEGIAEFTLTVDPQGRVAACKVTQSSGATELDVATCDLIKQRASFTPAIDAQGQATIGSYNNRVRWTLVSDRQQVKTVADTVMVIEPDGAVSTCRQSLNGGPFAPVPLGTGPCGRKAATAGSMYRDKAGNPARVLMRVQSTITFEPVP